MPHTNWVRDGGGIDGRVTRAPPDQPPQTGTRARCPGGGSILSGRRTVTGGTWPTRSAGIPLAASGLCSVAACRLRRRRAGHDHTVPAGARSENLLLGSLEFGSLGFGLMGGTMPFP